MNENSNVRTSDGRLQSYVKETDKNATFVLNFKSFLVFILLVTGMFIEYKFTTSYFDEIVGLVSIGVVALNWNKLSDNDLKAIFLLVLTVIIGLISNLRFGLAASWKSVGIDGLTQIKVFMTFYAVRYFLNEREKQLTLNYLSPIAKIYFIAAFIMLIYTELQTSDADMEMRYGFRVFKFIFHYNIEYTSVSFVMFAAVMFSTNTTKKSRVFFTVIGLVSIFFSLKSSAVIFTAVYIILSLYFKKFKKLDLKIILPMLVVFIFASSYQMQHYIMNQQAARRIFIDYSVITANHYFPLGSGFGTFGSAEAAKNYSPLYTQYQFYNHWGMGKGNAGMFLYDTYWPMVLGQFGWIGAFILILFFIRLFISIKNSKADHSKKAYIYAIFIETMIYAIGMPILSSSQGLLVFMALSLVCVPDSDLENKRIRRRFHFQLR